jgi:hypothetical protein
VRIGIDFDNTIVNYDRVFYRVALERGYIPKELAATKLVVREHLRRLNREDLWTEMQGDVYGSRMSDADLYPGAIEFLTWARDCDIESVIISHKTQYPFLGPRCDLHEAARNWIRDRLRTSTGTLLAEDRVYFEITKEAKLARVRQKQCNVFIDDLPEVLLAPAFPSNVNRILFDPVGYHKNNVDGLLVMAHWKDIRAHLEPRWMTPH